MKIRVQTLVQQCERSTEYTTMRKFNAFWHGKFNLLKKEIIWVVSGLIAFSDQIKIGQSKKQILIVFNEMFGYCFNENEGNHVPPCYASRRLIQQHKISLMLLAPYYLAWQYMYVSSGIKYVFNQWDKENVWSLDGKQFWFIELQQNDCQIIHFDCHQLNLMVLKRTSLSQMIRRKFANKLVSLRLQIRSRLPTVLLLASLISDGNFSFVFYELYFPTYS